ncbi:MAG: bifunctional phosphoglucose/phosphomannose isomerase [Candidatus Omnitrophica bacterium]|nr:bifunctional phosphoglucose/phosphomannose isomerase [Candidatus Omnitrophota bacterium]
MRGLNLKTIKKIDKSDMLSLLLDFPGQCKAALDIGKRTELLFDHNAFNKIVFCGLGGSAIGADLVRSYLYFESKIPIIVLREYNLPGYVDNSSLVFISSYSGNTEETLSSYLEAKNKNAFIITISSGGKLEEYAHADKITFIPIPSGLPPRCALGYLSIVPLAILGKLGIIPKVDIDSSIRQMIEILDDLKDNSLKPTIAQSDNLAKSIAKKLYHKFSIVYSPSVHFDVCATRLRGQLNENSKALASSHVFPEMNHNEIVGWQNPRRLFKDFVVLMLRDSRAHPRVEKRMNITKDILNKEGIRVLEIYSHGEDLLSRIFSLIYIGDFISYYLAILYGIDPTPVERVTYLKNQLVKE